MNEIGINRDIGLSFAFTLGHIFTLISVEKKVTVAQLAASFGVTGVTIRSYLRDLEHTGLITRTHGGAIERTRTGFEQDSRTRKVQNLEAKQQIALAAINLIEDDDTIVLDTGTTTHELAPLLCRRQNITVVTNDILIAQILEEIESVNIIFMGGLIRKRFHCTIDIQGRTMTEGLTVDKAFMGANSFSLEKGATTPDLQQAETKRNMVSVSAKVVLLCDHTKIGRMSLAQFADTDQIDTLITDNIGDKERQLIERADIEVIDALNK